MNVRIVSLLPAATEIVGALGLMDRLVGVSHECDYPDEANARPRVTHCEIHDRPISSCDIDRWVSDKLRDGGDIYTLDEATLHELRPDVILTQRLCDVCAPAYGSVAAFAQTLPGPPRVVNLEPNRLEDIFDNIRAVAEAAGVPERSTQVVQALRRRVQAVRERAATAPSRPRVAVIEWLDPVFCSGHWTPELVETAGGQEVFGRKWQDSMRKTWADVAQAGPEIHVIACCGQDVSRALQDWEQLKTRAEIQALPAVQSGRVHVADGSAYFSRPGPRIVDSLEILAEIIHPDLFAGRYPDRAVIHLGDMPAAVH